MIAPAIDPINFRDGVFYAVADLLGIDRAQGISLATSRRWVTAIQRHLGVAWKAYDWPELIVTEERAFRPPWNATSAWALGDEVFGTATGLYYRKVASGDVGEPVTNALLWQAFALSPGDYFLPILQRCRRRLGEIVEVYPTNPRATSRPPRGLCWERSERGLEIRGCARPTVFVRHKIPPLQYSAIPYDVTAGYPTDTLRLNSDGLVYRALQAVPAGIAPAAVGSADYWAEVPFPANLADYVVLKAAATEADDLQTSAKLEAEAEESLNRADDRRIIQTGGFPRYSLNRGRSASCCLTIPPDEFVTTLTAECMNEWGDVIPEENMNIVIEPDLPLVDGHGYLDIVFGSPLPISWKLRDDYIEYQGAADDSEVEIPGYVVRNRTINGFRIVLAAAPGADAADYHFKCRIAL